MNAPLIPRNTPRDHLVRMFQRCPDPEALRRAASSMPPGATRALVLDAVDGPALPEPEIRALNMPASITDVDTFTATVQGIADGDPLNKAHLTDLGIQHLSNRAKWLYNRHLGGGGGAISVPMVAAGSSQLAFDNDLTNHLKWRNATTTQGFVVFSIPSCFGAGLASVSAVIQGASGLVGLPTTMPTVRVYQVPNGSVPSLVGTETDGSATLGAYKTSHTVTATLSSPYDFVDGQDELYVRIDDDDGATAGFALYGVYATYQAS